MFSVREGIRDRVNVLFIVHYPELYGSIRSLMDLVSGLEEYGVSPHFILPANGGLSDYLDRQGYRYAVIRAESWLSEKHVPIKEKIRACQKLSRNADLIGNYLRQWSIDLVYTNTSVTPIGLLAAKRSGLPHIWHIREFGDLDFGLRFIFPKLLSKAFMLRSDAVICHSKAVRNYHFKPDVKNVYQIYNGVATKAQFDERLAVRQQSHEARPFTFVMMSVITPKKGQEVAIRAMAKLRDNGVDARLVIGGNGKADYIGHLTKLSGDLNLEAQVEFTGLIADPLPTYFAADCALICSENEAFSRAGLEATSIGLPLIGKNSGGNPEVIEHGRTGFLYDSFDELVGFMKDLALDQLKSQQMGLAGWQRARELFNVEDYAENIFGVIQNAMENR